MLFKEYVLEAQDVQQGSSRLKILSRYKGEKHGKATVQVHTLIL